LLLPGSCVSVDDQEEFVSLLVNGAFIGDSGDGGSQSTCVVKVMVVLVCDLALHTITSRQSMTWCGIQKLSYDLVWHTKIDSPQFAGLSSATTPATGAASPPASSR
jgi:hypothetical protein